GRLQTPGRVALLGGADAGGAIGEARRGGYTGDMWPVNPRRREVAGLPCLASLKDLPGAPNAVFLPIPAEPAIEAISQLAAMGAGGVVCYSAGFAETGGDGTAREKALREAAGGMALIGPNCYGMINYLDGSALWPFTHGGSCPGYGAAVITQSGMFSSDITMSQRSLPLTHMISAGNQAVLALEDFVEALAGNPAVRAIGLHIEGLRDVARFERAAVAAIQGGTPIVALKTGRSQIGAALTQSHTGSLSGANELYDALFDRTGVIAVSSPSQFVETLKYLCVAGAPEGHNIMGFTCSGGGATMLADHSESIGLSYPAFSEGDREFLQKLLPAIATVSNPLDYTTPIWGQPEYTKPVFAEAVTRSGADAVMLVQDYPAPGLDETRPFYLADAMALADAVQEIGLPAAICSTIHENMDADTRAELIARGIAPMMGIHEALNATAQAANWAKARDRIGACPPEPLLQAQIPDKLTMLHEAASKALLDGSGVALPDSALVSGKDAPAAAEDLGFPVALKMISTRLAHKTEAGAVRLGLDSAEAVAEAVAEMVETVRSYDPDAVSDFFLAERMAAPPVAEMIVGIRRDPQFGLAMTIGSGGVLVELLKDTATLLLPASATDIRRALERLKLSKLLSGFRGRQQVDLDGLAARLAELGDFALVHADSIAEIEINPLLVHENSVTAVDALIHVAGNGPHSRQ
ncbi:MAG: acetate--CoA ligase family protein, partial [Leisingera sp.]